MSPSTHSKLEWFWVRRGVVGWRMVVGRLRWGVQWHYPASWDWLCSNSEWEGLLTQRIAVLAILTTLLPPVDTVWSWPKDLLLLRRHSYEADLQRHFPVLPPHKYLACCTQFYMILVHNKIMMNTRAGLRKVSVAGKVHARTFPMSSVFMAAKYSTE